jgi:hypothetical protein
MKRCALLVAGLGLFCLAPRAAEAQVSFGPHIAWGDDTDFGVGGTINFGLGNAFGIEDGAFANLFGSVGATYFFFDCTPGFNLDSVNCTYYEINGNLAVPFTIEGSSIQPYVGAGIGLAHGSYSYPLFGEFDYSNTDVGLNILGGIFFPLGGLKGFAQGKFELSGGEQFVLSGGILFGD